MRPPRTTSRMSMGKAGGGSRASDEDGKTSVKVGTLVWYVSHEDTLTPLTP